MKNTGKLFEELCEKVIRIITDNKVTILRNQKLNGPDGLREFDIIYSFNAYGNEYTHFVECKDYNRNVDVIRIGEFINKCNDFNDKKISRKIFITGKGFSGGALSKAKREGIECWTINNFIENSKRIDLTIPILVSEIIDMEAIIDGECLSKEPVKMSTTLEYISDKPVLEILEKIKSKILQGEPKLEFSGKDIGIDETYIRDINGNKIMVINFSLKFILYNQFFLGHLTDIPESLLVDNKIDSKRTIILDPVNILVNYKKFQSYSDKKEIPINEGLLQILINVVPSFNFLVAPHINYISHG